MTYVQQGDHIVACLSGFCGTREQCLAGHPNQGFGIASYAEHMPLHENSLVRIEPEFRSIGQHSSVVAC